MAASAQLGDRRAAHSAKVVPGDDTKLLRLAALTRPLPVPPAPVPPTAVPVGERQVAGPAHSRATGELTAARPRTLRSSRSASVVVAAAVALVAVAGLSFIGQSAEPGVPVETAVAQVGAGETVWDVARRVAPQSDQRAVVERIRQLNGIVGSAVAPGQQLQVPNGR